MCPFFPNRDKFLWKRSQSLHVTLIISHQSKKFIPMQAIKCTIMFSWRRIEQVHHFSADFDSPWRNKWWVRSLCLPMEEILIYPFCINLIFHTNVFHERLIKVQNTKIASAKKKLWKQLWINVRKKFKTSGYYVKDKNGHQHFPPKSYDHTTSISKQFGDYESRINHNLMIKRLVSYNFVERQNSRKSENFEK